MIEPQIASSQQAYQAMPSLLLKLSLNFFPEQFVMIVLWCILNLYFMIQMWNTLQKQGLKFK